MEKANWHRVNRQINGAKSNIFPNRNDGNPHAWEVKSNDMISAKGWQRAKNRKFCLSHVSILKNNGCYVFSVSLDKRKVRDELSDVKFAPLMMQRLIERFYLLIQETNKCGMIVCDWSTYQMDHHISSCASSMTISRGMNSLIGGVTYGSSTAMAVLQASDIIASTFRREAEGQPHISPLAAEFRKLEYVNHKVTDPYGFAMTLRSIDRVF